MGQLVHIQVNALRVVDYLVHVPSSTSVRQLQLSLCLQRTAVLRSFMLLLNWFHIIALLLLLLLTNILLILATIIISALLSLVMFVVVVVFVSMISDPLLVFVVIGKKYHFVS